MATRAITDLDQLAPGVLGYAIQYEAATYLPLIVVERPGSGDVARFLDSLPWDRTWKVPSVVNGRLAGMLARCGFTREWEWAPELGENVEVWVRRGETMEPSINDAKFADWAILELMGHRRLGGFVREVELAGAGMLRIDIPREDGGMTTQFVSPNSLYAMTPTTEAIARAVAKRSQPEPAYPWELPQLEAPAPGDDEDPEDGYLDEVDLRDVPL